MSGVYRLHPFKRKIILHLIYTSTTRILFRHFFLFISDRTTVLNRSQYRVIGILSRCFVSIISTLLSQAFTGLPYSLITLRYR